MIKEKEHRKISEYADLLRKCCNGIQSKKHGKVRGALLIFRYFCCEKISTKRYK